MPDSAEGSSPGAPIREISPLDRPEIAGFFGGVDQVRRYLDRHLQDPERRCERLGRMAMDLVRPRSASELAYWLSRQLCEAVGARGAALLLMEPAWRPWRAGGQVQRLPGAEALATLARAPGKGLESIRVTDGGLLLPVGGSDGLLGAVWLEGMSALDPRSATLLLALIDTAGVLLEHGMKVEALSRDPRTGLPLERAFLAQVSAQRVAADAILVLFAFRVAGVETIREAQGAVAERRAMADLAAAVSEALPPDTQLGVRFDTVLALRQESSATAEATALARAQAVVQALIGRTTVPGPALTATTAYLQLSRLPADLTPHLDQLSRRLNEAPPGSIGRVHG
jgi:hypothetical protein